MSPTCAFTQEEWAALSGALRLRTFAERDAPRCLAAAELLQEQLCARLLERLTPVLGSPSPAVTASLLGKRLSFLATGACLYAMSVYDKGLLLSLDNTLVEYGHDTGLWTSSLPLQQPQPFACAAGQRSVRFRRTCCFYYQASQPVEYCSARPLLRPRKCR